MWGRSNIDVLFVDGDAVMLTERMLIAGWHP